MTTDKIILKKRFTYLHILGANQLHNHVYVQDTFHIDRDLISDPGQGHQNISFSAYFI